VSEWTIIPHSRFGLPLNQQAVTFRVATKAKSPEVGGGQRALTIIAEVICFVVVKRRDRLVRLQA
jgi:hypothetical protein